METAVRADYRAACREAPCNHRTTTHEATRTHKSASIGPWIEWTSPAVVPGASADKDSVREPARTVVAVRRATIRRVRVIAVSADRRPTHSNDDAHPDNDRSL